MTRLTWHVHHGLQAYLLYEVGVRANHELREVVLPQHPAALGAGAVLLKVPPGAVLAKDAVTHCVVNGAREQAGAHVAGEVGQVYRRGGRGRACSHGAPSDARDIVRG